MPRQTQRHPVGRTPEPKLLSRADLRYHAAMHYPVTVRIAVQWGDLDVLGHVNNVHYFRWFESARIAYLERLGIATQGQGGPHPVLAATHCDFHAPLFFPASVDIGARITRVGRTSLTMEYALWHQGAPDKPLARGGGVVVLVDGKSGQATPVSDPLRQQIVALEGNL